MNFNNFKTIKKPEKKKVVEFDMRETKHVLPTIFQYCETCKKPTVQNEVNEMNFICQICKK